MDTPEQPQWLDEDERDTWLSLIGLTMRLPAVFDSQLRRDAGLTLFEYHVLAGLSEQEDGTLRMSELAALAEGTLPRLSQVVSRLEKRGWVRRTPDPNDGRTTLAVLTEAGRETMVAIAPGHVAEVRRLVFDPLTRTQQRALRDACRRITEAVDPNGPCSR